jgi:ketosteroid isomerase-like protein
VFEKVRTEFGLPETELAEQAYLFAERIEPDFVFAHSVRSYLYAREVAGRRPSPDHDDELVFLACVLHDIGLTAQGNGDQRFEVDGADLAADFLRERGMDERRVRVVWDAIALHTSDVIAARMGPEVALAQVGIGTDLFGFGREDLPADLVARAHAVFPRADLGYTLTEAIVEQVVANPHKAALTTLGAQLVRWHRPIGTLPDWTDFIAASGWDDRPPASRPAGTAGAPEELGPLFERFLAAGDLAGLVSLYEPRATFHPEPGRLVSGTDAIRESLGGYVEAGAQVSLALRAIHTVGDLALLSSRAEVRGLGPGGEVLSTTTTEVARRQPDGRWLYAVDDPFFEQAKEFERTEESA